MKEMNLTACPSLFKSMFCNNSQSVKWAEVFNIITGPTLRLDTMKYRSYLENGLDDDAQKLKRRMMSFTPAVECNGGRKNDCMVALTGVGLCDFDHLDNIAEAVRRVQADKHCMLEYVTISGSGLRVLFRYTVNVGDKCGAVTPDAAMMKAIYSLAFKAGNEYFAKLISADADGQCKNVGRLSVMCHDAGAVLNESCEPFCIKFTKTGKTIRKTKAAVHGTTVAKAARAVTRKLAAEGIEYAEGTFNQYVSRAGYYLNQLGVRQDEAEVWAVERFDDYDGQAVKAIIRSCYQDTTKHGTLSVKSLNSGSKDDTKAIVAQKIEDYLDTQAEFRFNVITHKTEFRMKEDSDGWHNITDRDENTFWARMNKDGIAVKPFELHNVIISEYVTKWNPFTDYFKGLPDWDGKTDYIGELAQMVHVKADDGDKDAHLAQERFAKCFKKWLVAAVASLIDDNVVNNVILVLIGRQGIYKTTFFNYLLPEELQQYFFTKVNSDTMSKDDRLALAEFAIICLEEIDSMRTPELNQLKALVTTKTISERAAYEHNKENRPHIASFCGTGNNTQFLTDQTGNRRWLPFEVDSIENPRTHKYDYTGIFSQAMELWQSGFTYWFSQSETDAMISHIAKFEVPSVEEELISTYYRVPKRGEQYQLVSATNVIEHVNALIKRALSTVKVGVAMRKQGFEQVKQDGKRCYKVIVLNVGEIASHRKVVDSDEAKNQELPF